MHKKIKIQKPSKRKSSSNVIDTALLSAFHTEIFGNCCINFDGCISVCDYNSEYIKLRIKDGYLTLTGKNLEITLFEGQQLTAKGNIFSLEFCLRE